MTSSRPPLPFRFFWIWIVGLVALFFLFRPALGVLKHWRADFFLSRAEKAFTEGKLDYAKEQSLLCLQLHPEYPKAFRLLAKITEFKKDSVALSLWNHLVSLPDPWDSDRLELAELALREGQIVLASQQTNILLSRKNPAKETYNVAGLLALRQNQHTLARTWFQQALEMDSGYTRAKMNLARLDLYFGGSRDMETQGIDELKKIAIRQDEWGLESLRALVEWGILQPLSFPYQKILVDELRKHPLAQFKDRCLAADWEIKTHPEKESACIASMVASVENLSISDKRDLAAWLNRYKAFEKTLSLFPLDLKGGGGLILVQLDALAGLGRWQEIQKYLANEETGMPPMLRSLFRARASRELGDERSYRMGWRETVQWAKNNNSELQYLIRYAETMGDWDAAVEATETLSQSPDLSAEALYHLVELYGILGNTKELHRTLQRLSVFFPKDPAVMNDVTYIGLLLDQSTALLTEKALEIYHSDSQLPAFVVTYALSQLKAQHPEVALKAFDGISANQLAAPHWKAIYAATLLANGKKTEADEIVKQIDFKKLKPEEKKLLESFGR